MPDLLIVAETDGREALPATLPLLAFAQQYARLAQRPFDLLVLGGPQNGGGDLSADWTGYGARTVIVGADERLEHTLADVYAVAAAQAVRENAYDVVAGASTQFGRDILPRVAGLLGASMVTDVLSVHVGDASGRGIVYKRPMYAGSVIATVAARGRPVVLSVRTAAFGSPTVSADGSDASEVRPLGPIDFGVIARPARWVSADADPASGRRPDLAAASVVVSGGRPLRDAETFERLIGGLADRLGGAAGATRAAVDAGIAPNDIQVGQTGKIVAPGLYIAAGISGSIQHLAGMKDSKTIVAVNTDASAPIFAVSDYGLVADLFDVLPEMQRKL